MGHLVNLKEFNLDGSAQRVGAVCSEFEFVLYKKLLRQKERLSFRLRTKDSSPFLQQHSLVLLKRDELIPPLPENHPTLVTFWNSEEITVGVYGGMIPNDCACKVLVYDFNGLPKFYRIELRHLFTALSVKLSFWQRLKYKWDTILRSGKTIYQHFPSSVEPHSPQ